MTRSAWLLIIVVALVAAIAVLPLRLALDMAGATGLDATRVEGSIWRGRIIGASVGGVALGDLETRARPWPPGLAFAGPALSGTVTRQGVADLRGRIGPVAQWPFARIAVDAVAVTPAQRGSGGLCSAASGRISVVPAMLPDIGELSGPLACDNGQLRATLVPAGGDTLAAALGTAQVDVAVGGDRRFTLALRIGNVPELARLALRVAGFRDTAEGMILTREGRL
jgi:hypothetical protein